ncbi:unnamed protein product [Lactuca virosa]|uniref:HTH HARE-type domain-containing protein n=1 Tax=Lactuca virosa TaxID=75947 RepID=A0AAU9P0R3_9ASTR|nr:unnamed protein product [Lactuca virosa]
MQTEATVGVVEGGGPARKLVMHHQRPVQQQQSQVGTVSQLIAGGVVRAVSKTCTAPLARLTILFQGVDGGDIISNLRSGVAAEKALAIIQERGFSNRRSRHRLTPGIVKYADFHVLSFEGSHCLSILDVVEKIQKSGLRDLTTSKTPEASIAATLSRW